VFGGVAAAGGEDWMLKKKTYALTDIRGFDEMEALRSSAGDVVAVDGSNSSSKIDPQHFSKGHFCTGLHTVS